MCVICGQIRVGGWIEYPESSIEYRAGGLPIISGDSDRTADAGATGEARVLAGTLSGEDLALLVAHRAEVIDPFEDLYTAEPAQGDAVTGLTEPEPGLEHGVQQIAFVDDSHLATRRLAANG